MSDEVRKRMSEGGKGRVPWNKGKPLSEAARQKISEFMKTRTPRRGFKLSEEQKRRHSEMLKGRFAGAAHPNAKTYENLRLVSPDGTIYHTIVCLKTFCDEHGLLSSGLLPVLQGKNKSYKKWRLLPDELSCAPQAG